MPLIEPALARLRRPLGERALSDTTFENLYLFRTVHRYRFLGGPLPCIEGQTYDGASQLVPLFDLTSVPLPLLRELQGGERWFFPVPHTAVIALDSACVQAEAHRDDADYLYEAAAFLDYGKPGLGYKRNAVTRLRSTFRIEAYPLDEFRRQDALSVLEGWCLDKGLDASAADVASCREALEGLGTESPLRGYVHYADGAPAGFLLVEEINPGVVVVRFSKGRREFDGISPCMYQDLVAAGRGAVRWLNFEQDLGKPTFRRSKESFRPTALLEKFRVRVRG